MMGVTVTIAIFLNLLISSQNYSISLNFPFQITNKSSIAYMRSDFGGYFFIQF